MTTTTTQSGVSLLERPTPSGSTTPSRPRSEVTPLEVARKALELADENPDARGDCNYLTYDLDDHVVGGNCLFGQALLALGVDAEDLRRYEGSSIEAVLLRLKGDDTESPITALTYAQFAQDEGKRWGHEDIRGNLVEYIEANS